MNKSETSQPILVFLTHGLSAISFMHEGKIIDPRIVLIGLARGEMRIEYEEQWHKPQGAFDAPYLQSQTFTIVAVTQLTPAATIPAPLSLPAAG